MKVFHVFDHSIPLHSGYTFRSQEIITHQRNMGWQTYHITSVKHTNISKQQTLEENVNGLHFYRTLDGGRFLKKIPILNQISVINTLAKRLDSLVAKIRPDLIHAHSPALNGVAALKVGKKYGIPVVYEVRAFWEDAAVDHGTSKEGGLRYKATRSLETYVLKKADAITTICEGLKRDIIQRPISIDKITVIPNAVDAGQFRVLGQRDEQLEKVLKLENKSVIGFVGSFYAYEGLDLLMRAIPALLEKHKNIEVLMVGGGPEEETLRKMCGELQIDSHVRFVGRVPHEQVQRYYSLIDILVYPRKKMRLTDLVTPLKPLEAMAQGKLVLASDVGGHIELINDGVNGFLFTADDVAALIKMLDRIIDNRNQWFQIAKNGRTYVETERTWARSVGRYEIVYKNLLGNKSYD